MERQLIPEEKVSCMLFKKIDTWIAVAFMALSIGVYSVASGYDPLPSRFPLILSLCTMALAILLVINTLRKCRIQQDETATSSQGVILGNFIMPLIVGIGMCAYAASLEFCGFIAPSILLMFFIAWVLGYRRAGMLLLVALLVVLAVYGIFDQLLGVPLPELPFFTS